MAKESMKERNKKRIKLADKYANRRAKLKAIIMNKESTLEEVFAAQLKLQQVPRNSNPNRVRNRCGITGRPHGYYRKFNMSRIQLRELANQGKIPGVVKSSW
ncbi:MAG: 30S ribosomal protein S14 [Alphaproteobacteria bacterium]